MVCPKCKSINDDNSSYCNSCGSILINRDKSFEKTKAYELEQDKKEYEKKKLMKKIDNKNKVRFKYENIIAATLLYLVSSLIVKLTSFLASNSTDQMNIGLLNSINEIFKIFKDISIFIILFVALITTISYVFKKNKELSNKQKSMIEENKVNQEFIDKYTPSEKK